MQFAHKIYLYLLGLIPVILVLYFITAAWRKRAIRKFGDVSLVQGLMRRFSPRRKFIKMIMLLLAFTMFVIALANLRMGSKREKVQRQGSDIVVCFDVSRSMLAEDIKPDRLTRAKILASQIIEELSGNKVALVVFAGRAYVQMPLTVDVRASLMYLNTVNTDMVSTQGTSIGEAIDVAMQVFENGAEESTAKKENKAIIIITDGESHDEATLEEAKKAADENIKIITVGVGTTQGAPIPIKHGNSSVDYKKDRDGNIILTKLNEQALQEVATAGQGKYMNLSEGNNVLRSIRTEIGSLDKEEGEQYEFTEYKNHFQLFLFLGLILLTIEFFMSDKRPLWLERINIFDKDKTDVNA